jgi:YD repeat-containing protein
MKSLSLLRTESLSPHRTIAFRGWLRSHLAWVTLGLLSTLAVPCAHAASPSTSVTIVNTGKDSEGLRTFQLQWTATPKAAYLVQSTTNLALAQSWRTVDVITPDTAQAQCTIKGRSIPENSIEFFRLVLPQPRIDSVEPAVLTPSVPAQLYIIGQCFSSNDVLRINGITQTNTTLVDSSLRTQPSFTPDVAGDYLFELVISGQVVSSFHVTSADPFTSPDLVLQGPPTYPPAAPDRAWLSKKGYDYYQAQSQLASAGLHNNPAFQENQNAGEMPHGRLLAPWASKKGYDYYQAAGRMSTMQEGKKGLNAVNVKQAFTVGEDCDDNDPAVIPFSGEVVQQVVDLAVEGSGLDFVWARTYHSRIGRTGSSANGWTFSYDIHLQPLGGDILVHDGTGRADTFKLNTNGTYTCPELFREGTLSNNVFRITFADTGYWEFNALDGTAGAGTLSRIVDRNNNTLSLYYTKGQLTQIVDDLGRTNTIGYGSDGRLATVTDFSGRTITYTYYSGKAGEPGSAGDLASVTSPPVVGTPNGNDFPSGKTTTYTYSSGFANDAENHLLLSVINATGQATHQHVYQHNQSDLEFLRCRSMQRGTNTPIVFSYLPQTPAPSNQFATARCIMNDGEGNVTECFFDARNRCVKLQEYTGRSAPNLPVTATVNRPTNKLRSSDPDYFECRWDWNNDSLCRRIVMFGGQTSLCRYESDFNSATSPRRRAEIRVLQELACCDGADTDGDGIPDLTQRECRFEYDPRFGSDPTPAARGKKLFVGNLPFSASERGPRQTTDLSGTYHVDSAKIITDRDSGRSKGFGFVTSEIDARGNACTGSYDTNGNVIQAAYARKDGTVVAADFTYHPKGRLAAITNAPDGHGYRRVDTFAYYTNGPQSGYLQSIAIDEPGVQLTTTFEYDDRGNLTRAVDPRGNDCKWHNNALNQCVRFETPTNLVARCATDYFYDANNNLVQVATEVRDETDALLGSRLVLRGLDRSHRLTRMMCSVNSTQFMTNDFVYNNNDQCVLALGGEAVAGVDPHHAVAYQYDERGLTYLETAAPGSPVQNTTQYDYDASGNLTRLSDGLESSPAVTTFEYDGFAKSKTGGGRVQGMMGQKAKAWMVNNYEVHPVFGLKTDWNPKLEGGKEGLASTWVATVWNKQCVEKDIVIRLARTTDPMGNVTTLNYDANDNLKVVRHFGQTNDVPGTNGNIRLAESRFVYDELDQCVTSYDLFFDPATQQPLDDGARTTAFAFAPNGQCSSITDDLGRITTFGYDTAGRPSTRTSPSQRTEFAVLRNRNGSVTSCTQTDLPDLGGAPQVFSWTNVYDSLERCVLRVDNVGNTNRVLYNSLDQPCVLFNPKEYSIKRTFDSQGRCTLEIRDLDGDGLFNPTYDVTAVSTWSSSSDRLLATSDSHSNTTTYGYDSCDHCTSITNADHTRLALVWSPRSNLIQETDANGTVIVHTYDLDDRCISNSITPGAGVAATTTFETFAFDGCSRLVAATNNASDCEFAYDSHGNRTRDVSGGFGALTRTHNSLQTSRTRSYPSGRVLSYFYDPLVQCTNIVESGASIASFSYAGPGRVARINYGNGTRAQITYDGLVGSQNPAGDFGQGQVINVTHASPIQGTLRRSASVDLTWDRNGNKASRTDTIYAPAVPRTNALSLAHDPVDRLTHATLLSGSSLLRDTTYGLDRMGNRTNVTGSPSCSGNYFMDAATPGPLDFQMNQYTATPCDSRTYDDNGNLLTRSSAVAALSYTYDYADRLVAVSDSGSPVASYAYDPLGRRIAKTVYASGGLPPVTTQFVYDGAGVIEERVNGSVTASFVLDATRSHDDEVVRTFTWTQLSGPFKFSSMSGPLAMRRSGQDYFYHTDDQGNLLALSGAGGSIVERCDYDDYGAVTFLTGDGVPSGATASSVGNPYCWGGLRLDSETGLQNDDGGSSWDPASGRKIHGVHRGNPLSSARTGSIVQLLTRNDPWSGDTDACRNTPRYIVKSDGIVYDLRAPGTAGSGWSGPTCEMKTGTVKFFNEAKGFGFIKEEGGRHTPFQNKYHPQFRTTHDQSQGNSYAMYGVMK